MDKGGEGLENRTIFMMSYGHHPLWKLFFEAHLILDAKTTFRLQKTFDRKIKNKSCLCY